MSFKFKINSADSSFVGYTGSTLFHVTILALVLIALNISDNRSKINSQFVQVITQDFTTNAVNHPDNITPSAKMSAPKKTHPDNAGQSAVNENPGSTFYNLTNTSADTTSLDQVYNEPTLNVTMKYPAGWTYIDQDINKKLDGVTFWPPAGNFSPPPYINLEVKDKDLFDARRYKYNTKTWGYTIYFNDPEEMENQVSQIFYIRTNSGEDFSLKLIMTGKDAFKAFQPVFFGMLKSFKFGKGLF